MASKRSLQSLVSVARSTTRSLSVRPTTITRSRVRSSLPPSVPRTTWNIATQLRAKSTAATHVPDSHAATESSKDKDLNEDPASVHAGLLGDGSHSTTKGQPIAQLEQRLSLTFTCTVEACGHRSSHEFSKKSYERGIVLVQCPGCKNRHLIADHLGWFNESTEDGKLKTVEDLVKARGEQVRRGVATGGKGDDGTLEYVLE